jgi:hypothetical protein
VIFSGWIWRLFVDADFAGANLAALAFVVTTVLSMVAVVLFIDAVKSAYFAANSPSEAPAKVFAHSFLGATLAQPRSWNPRAFAASLGFILLIAIVALKKFNFQPQLPFSPISDDYDINFFFIVIAFNAYLVGVVVASLRMMRRRATRTFSLLLVSVFGFLMMAGNGTSASLSEMSAFLGVGMLVASGMSISSRSMIMPTLVMLIAVNACGSLVADKFSEPYSWWGIGTGEVNRYGCASVSGMLNGLCIDKESAKGITATVDAITHSTTPSQAILSFPNIPIFALMANRALVGRSPIPWFDFMSQEEGEVLLKTLHDTPPGAIVIARLPDTVYDSHEKAFNSGARGVHREIAEYIDELWKTHRVTLVTENMINGVNVQVFRYSPEM